MARKDSSVETLLPYEVDGVRLAGVVRAADWVFATGILPTDLGGRRGLLGEPAWTTQYRSLFARAQEVLKAAGSDLSRTVRCDQFARDYRSVPFFHEMRRQACGRHIPPSTTVLEDGVLRGGMTMNMVARGTEITPLFPDGLDVPATSSFVPVMKSGGFVFVAGFMAAWKPGDLGGIAPEARVPEGHLWKGNRIQLELDYLVTRKLKVALEGAGSSLAQVAKADVSIRDLNDVPAFNQVWRKHFGDEVPATTFWPTSNPGLAIEDARVEINLVAYAGERERIEAKEAAPFLCDGYPAAVRAGDLLFVSGLAGDTARLVPVVDAICRKAGARLDNVLRIQHAHSSLGDFKRACGAWQKRLPKRPLPISAFQVPKPLLVPRANVHLDLWVHCP